MLKDVLQKLRVSDLQNEIRKVLADFKGFKNMKKAELIEVMLENESLFKHLDKVDTTEFKKKTVPKPKGKIQKQREEDKPVKEKLKKEPTEYVKFVKQYRMKNNLSLKDAMKKIKEKGLYKAKSPAKPKVKLSKEEQVKKEDKKSRNNIRKKLVEYEKTVTDDPKTRDKTQFLKLKKIIGKKTPFQKKKRRMLREQLPKMYEKLKELNFFEDIDIEKEESKSVKKEEKLKDDDFSYLGITNEEAEELLGIKKKTPSKKLSLDEMIKKNNQFKQDIKDLEEQKRTVKKTSEVADRIRSEIVDLKEKSIALERQILEAKDKLEDENIKQKKIDEEKEEERELLEFKINVEKFIKKPTEELNDKILDNLDYIDELSQKDQDRLNKALDKFEEGEEEPTPAPKKKEPKKEEPKKGLLTDSEYNKLKAELSKVPDVLNYYNDLKKVLKEKTEELKKNKTLSLKEKEIELKLEYENIKKNVKDNNLENYSFSSKNEFYLKIFKLKLEAKGGAGGIVGQTTKNSKTEKAQEELDKIPQKEILLYNEINRTPSISINNDLYLHYMDSVEQFKTSSLDLRSNIKEYGNEEDKKIMRKKISFKEKRKLIENNFKKSKPAPKKPAQKKEEPKKEESKTTSKLSYNQFVSEYRKKNNLSLKDSMKEIKSKNLWNNYKSNNEIKIISKPAPKPAPKQAPKKGITQGEYTDGLKRKYIKNPSIKNLELVSKNNFAPSKDKNLEKEYLKAIKENTNYDSFNIKTEEPKKEEPAEKYRKKILETNKKIKLFNNANLKKKLDINDYGVGLTISGIDTRIDRLIKDKIELFSKTDILDIDKFKKGAKLKNRMFNIIDNLEKMIFNNKNTKQAYDFINFLTNETTKREKLYIAVQIQASFNEYCNKLEKIEDFLKIIKPEGHKSFLERVKFLDERCLELIDIIDDLQVKFNITDKQIKDNELMIF